MNETAKARKSESPAAWTTDAPYTAMLRDYEAAAARLDARLHQLRAQLRGMQQKGTAAQPVQILLERRIMVLRDEHDDLFAVMRTLRLYAEREAQS